MKANEPEEGIHLELKQVKGNTWVLEGIELIPLYKLDDNHCVLLDTGHPNEVEELEQALTDAGLIPVGLLCSHAHPDHYGNSLWLKEKYGTITALSSPETALLNNWLTMKSYYLTIPLDTVIERNCSMVRQPDVILPDEDDLVWFCGAQFQILHVPGHSPGLISVITPDNVCYVSDAMLSEEMLTAKLPHNQNHHIAIASREKIRHAECDLFIMAHKGICDNREISAVIDANLDLLYRRGQEILSLIDRPMTFSEINHAAVGLHKLYTHRPYRALVYQRNVTFIIEYLLEEGELEMECHEGVVRYCRTQTPEEY